MREIAHGRLARIALPVRVGDKTHRRVERRIGAHIDEALRIQRQRKLKTLDRVDDEHAECVEEQECGCVLDPGHLLQRINAGNTIDQPFQGADRPGNRPGVGDAGQPGGERMRQTDQHHEENDQEGPGLTGHLKDPRLAPARPADKPTEQIVANSAQGQSTSAYTAPAALPPTKIEDNTSALTANQKPQHQSSIATSSNLASGPRPFKDRPVSMDKPSQIELELASMATLKDIQQQGNPKRLVTVTLSKASLKIGRDSLDLTIKSNHDGFVYIVLLGSDSKSFYILYPNGLDQNNRIHAGESLRVPKSDWQVLANGPVGTDNLLVMVSDSPRKLNGLNMASPTASEPFTYALNDIGGRGVLIEFLTGSGVDGKSESFGSTLVSLKEIK